MTHPSSRTPGAWSARARPAAPHPHHHDARFPCHVHPECINFQHFLCAAVGLIRQNHSRGTLPYMFNNLPEGCEAEQVAQGGREHGGYAPDGTRDFKDDVGVAKF